MRSLNVLTLWAGVGLVLIAAQSAPAGFLVGFPLNESGDLGTGHTLYGHGATITTSDFAPGGYSSESMLCNDPNDRFYGITGDYTFGGAAMTWVCWLKLDSALWNPVLHTYAYAGAVGNLYDHESGEFMLWVEDTTRKIHFNLGEGGASAHLDSGDSGVTLPLDTWTHVAVVFDEGAMTMYVNGSPVSTTTSSLSAVPVTAGREGWLGAAPNANAQWWGGIDEFAILDQALDQGGVQNIIDNGIVSLTEPPPGVISFVLGYTLQESGDLGPDAHSQYGHGATVDTGQFAPGGYSTESLSCRTVGEDRFTAVVGAVENPSKHTYAFAGTANNLFDGEAGEFELYMEDTTRKLHFVVGTGSGSETVSSPAGIPMDEWVHVAAVFDAGELRLYINGQRVASVSTGLTSFPSLAGREVFIGASPNASNQWLGWIDEFAWFEGALNADQVRQIMDIGLLEYNTILTEPGPGVMTYLIGFDLNESPDLSCSGHTLFSHGATFNDVDHAPGTYSTESSAHVPPGDEMGDRMFGVVGDSTYGAAQMSWVCWLKLDGMLWESNKHTYAFAGAANNFYDNQAGEFLLWIEDTTRKVRFNLGDGTASASLIGGSMALDTWTHVAVVFDNGQLRMYLDGQRVANTTSTMSEVPALPGREIWLGAAPYFNNQWLGRIDEFAWFEGALNAFQVRDLMADGLVATFGTVFLDSDLNGDCYVNWQDFSVFAGQWLASGCGSPDWCDGADLNQDTDVNWADFSVFASQWLHCTDPAEPACDQYWR